MTGCDLGSDPEIRTYWGPIIDTRFSPAPLEQIDSELLVLQEMMTRALRLRNECAAACKLPLEILVKVFLLLRDVWPPHRDYSASQPVFWSGWMAITHVCSKWRLVRAPLDVAAVATDQLIPYRQP